MLELTRLGDDRNQGWDVVDDRAQLRLARSQQFFGALAIVDVCNQIVPAEDRTVLLAHWDR
ncbi:MAG: hypothetical protein WDO74_26015 [Pseudomonadota bacterium]